VGRKATKYWNTTGHTKCAFLKTVMLKVKVQFCFLCFIKNFEFRFGTSWANYTFHFLLSIFLHHHVQIWISHTQYKAQVLPWRARCIAVSQSTDVGIVHVKLPPSLAFPRRPSRKIKHVQQFHTFCHHFMSYDVFLCLPPIFFFFLYNFFFGWGQAYLPQSVHH